MKAFSPRCRRLTCLGAGFACAVILSGAVGFLIGMSSVKAWAVTEFNSLNSQNVSQAQGVGPLNTSAHEAQPLVLYIDTGLGLNPLELALLITVLVVAALWLYCACHSNFFLHRSQDSLVFTYSPGPRRADSDHRPKPPVSPVLRGFLKNPYGEVGLPTVPVSPDRDPSTVRRVLFQE